ncbi:MAG: Zn-dependent hydrolase [Wenzhouxiangellaceae bacterium]|nr:Zn-dependent hydrolase [Wenzhouxiangellaceae bacterium]
MIVRTVLLAIMLAWALQGQAQPMPADADRMQQRIDALAAGAVDPAGGISRLAYSDADIAGRELVMEWMRGLGLEVRIDAAGNIFGRRAGTGPDLPPILFGSHIDSVPNGGRYDGPAGVVAALEAIELLDAGDTATRHPLEVVVFAAEEAGLLGAKAFAGILDSSALDETVQAGMTVAEGMARIGGRPDALAEAAAAPGEYRAYVELHIEQGAILFEDGIDIGVVQGIVGIDWWDVIVEGVANHGGTTPMNRRYDALVTAAKFVLAVERIASGMPGRQVATVGRIRAFPGAPNVVPGRVEASLEIRDLDSERILEVFGHVRTQARKLAAADGTTIAFRKSPIHEVPAETDPRLQDIIEAAARRRGYSSLRMPSGAGHDAQAVAHLAPIGMIFVPSRNGISHAPEEFTSSDDLARGAEVLLDSVLAIDAAVW